jgi:hypothetical protein
MNYPKIYGLLVNRAKTRNFIGYTENHHVIPRCMGGTDHSENLVALTPEEHYVAHQLLIKIYPDNVSLIRAAQMMTVGRTNNKLYGWLRRKWIESLDWSGENNSQYGTRWITDGKQNRKIDKISNIPEGWKAGRFIQCKPRETTTCLHCGSKFEIERGAKYCSRYCGRHHKRSTVIVDNYPKLKSAYISNGMIVSRAFRECKISRNGYLAKEFLKLFDADKT